MEGKAMRGGLRLPALSLALAAILVPCALHAQFPAGQLQYETRGGIGTPVVIQLTDDDGDTRITACDIPEIVTNTHVFSGDDGRLLFQLDDALCEYPGFHYPAAGDINNDGRNEIVVADRNGRICAFTSTGALLWKSVDAGSTAVHQDAAVWDLDGDGTVEVISGGLVVRGVDGSTISNDPAPRTVITDRNLDGTWEVVEPGGAVAAVGELDLDFYPEFVTLSGTIATAIDDIGGQIWSLPGLPQWAQAPPCLGDFDGDTLAEVAFSTNSEFFAVDDLGDPMWTQPVNDFTGNNSGCSIFDFNLDGVLDIVYKDSSRLYIFNSLTGAVQWSTGVSSGTYREVPVIADVDGDGAAEIVLAGSQVGGGQEGVVVFGSPDWAPARRVWNQEGYSVSHVEESGRIVSNPAPRWLSDNDYRAQAHACPCDNPLVTDFTWTRGDCGRASLCFQATSSGGTPPVSYLWDFGPGWLPLGSAPCRDFGAPGSRVVRVAAIDSTGCRVEQSHVVDVPAPLQVSFEVPDGCLADPVCLDGIATGGVQPHVFEWDFGDGSPTQPGQAACNDYGGFGSFLVTFTVRDADGCQAEAQNWVAVGSAEDIPEVSPAGSPRPLRVERHGADLAVLFEATGFEAGVYRGFLDTLRSGGYNHAATGACRQPGSEAVFPALPGNAYFLVAAGACENPRLEGPYGGDSKGEPRPMGSPPCP